MLSSVNSLCLSLFFVFVQASVCRSQEATQISLADNKVVLSNLKFDPPIGSNVDQSYTVQVTFDYINDTGEDLTVYVAPQENEGELLSGHGGTKLAKGKGTAQTSFDFGWEYLDPNGDRVLMNEFDETTRKYERLPIPDGAHIASRISEMSGIEIGVDQMSGIGIAVNSGRDASQKIHDKFQIPAKFSSPPVADSAMRTTEAPVFNLNAVALAKYDENTLTVAVISHEIGSVGRAVLVDTRVIAKDGTTKISKSTESFLSPVIRSLKRSDAKLSTVAAWTIDGKDVPLSELTSLLATPKHVILIPPHIDGKTVFSKYYQSVLSKDLLILRLPRDAESRSL